MNSTRNRRHRLAPRDTWPQAQFEQLEHRRVMAVNAAPSVLQSAAALPSADHGGTTITTLSNVLDVGSDATVKNPQSKTWQKGGTWWTVFDTNTSTNLYRLDNGSWTQVSVLSSSKYNADVLPVGNGDVTYALLYSGASSKLAKFTWTGTTYTLTPLVSPTTPLAPVQLSSGSDTATIALDTTGRMWIAADTSSTIEVRYADAPYTAWSAPITLATTSSVERELSAIVAFGGKIGVLWSDHATQRFGFRYHVDGALPTSFSANEVPASQSAKTIGSGMADDHLNIKVAADGTLYAAVKTSWDRNSLAYPEMALLVRRPNGTWDPLYGIDAHGTRPIVELNETTGFLRIVYSGDTGTDDIVYKDIPFAEFNAADPNKFYSGPDQASSLFPRKTLIGGGLSKSIGGPAKSFNGESVFIATTAASKPDNGPYVVTTVRVTDLPQAANLAPANTVPGAQTTLEDTALVFSAATANALSISDPDGGTTLERVIITSTNGKFTLGTTNLTVIGNGTAYVSATGKIADINAALAGASFLPATNYFGAAAIKVQTSDLGNGGARTATSNVAINVLSVNDPPRFTKGPTDTVLEDSGPRTVVGWATKISPGPANEATQTVSFVVTNNNNGLFSVQPSITPDGTLSYTPAPDANGKATVTIVLKDSGGKTNGGVPTSAPINVTINVTSVNDAPSFVPGISPVLLEDAGKLTYTNWATSISAGPANESGQSLKFTTTTDNPGLFNTQPSIASDGTLSFKLMANTSGSAKVTVLLKDSYGTLNGGVDAFSYSFWINATPVNDAPTFAKGLDQTIAQDSGPQSVANWATGISAGPNEANQSLNFVATNNNNALFSVQPAISTTGTLTYTPAPGVFGTTTVSVYLHDNGGTANGGVDNSVTRTFKIIVTATAAQVAAAPSSSLSTSATLAPAESPNSMPPATGPAGSAGTPADESQVAREQAFATWKAPRQRANRPRAGAGPDADTAWLIV